MLKLWGWLGLVLVIFAGINFVLKIEPFTLWYFPVIWLGYILFIDSIVFKIKGSSLISNNFGKILGMFLISPLIWWIFEFFNLALKNWHYIGAEPLGVYSDLFSFLAFSTVMPAFFETFDLMRALFKSNEKHKKKSKIKPAILYFIIFLGAVCLILPLAFPKYFFPLIWISLFLILDPINCLRRQPSLINQFKNRNYSLFLAIFISILIMAFLWEFWNYFASIKWVYTIQFVSFAKVFEIPILGYLGYIPFSLELYSIYYFVRSLFKN